MSEPGGNVDAWNKIARRYQAETGLGTDSPHYGPDVPTERELKLVGDVKGKRVLELGCGGGQCSIAFAKLGGVAIGIDASAEQLAYAKRLAEREEVRVEWHHGDLADLAFLRADSIDVAFSAYAFSYVADLSRVLRQVHRVLRHHGLFVFSYEHPFALAVEWPGVALEAPVVQRSYFDRGPTTVEHFGETFTVYPRTVGDVFVGLARSGFRIEALVEPEPTGDEQLVPPTIIWRARKEGA